MKRVCIAFAFIALILISGAIAYADSLPQLSESIYDSGVTTDEAVENTRTNQTALLVFLSPLFVTIVGGSVLYVLKRRRGEKVTFFGEDQNDEK